MTHQRYLPFMKPHPPPLHIYHPNTATPLTLFPNLATAFPIPLLSCPFSRRLLV